MPRIPTHWLERLRAQARSRDRALTLELVDEYSGGDPAPMERPYFPWDLEPAPAVNLTYRINCPLKRLFGYSYQGRQRGERRTPKGE